MTDLHPVSAPRARAAASTTSWTRCNAVLTGGPVRAEHLDDGGVPDTGRGTVSRSATRAPAPVAVGVLGHPAAGYRPSGATSSSR